MTEDEVKKLPQDKFKLAYKYNDKYIVLADQSEVMNHSCNPNLWWVDDESLSASRDIQPGEDITYNYASTETNPETMPDMRCNCRATDCRKIITASDCLDLKWQEKYSGHIPSWTKKFILENS